MSRQQRLTLVATILGSTIVFLDATVVNVALPAMKRDLSMGLAGQQWVVEAYLLALVSLLLVGGSMGDQFGRRRLFEIGLAGFGVTSLLCAVAPSEEFLIAFRALQGMAGALLVPGSLAIVAATFNGEARGKAVGTWTAWTGIATVVGPAGGGFLVETISWRAIFAVNIPLVVINLILTRRAVAESRDPDAFMGIDFGGISLSALGLGGPVFALIEQPSHGWGDPLVFVPLIAGIACFIAFVVHEMRTEHPMVDLALFRIRNFAFANLTTLVVYAGLIGGTFYIPLFLQQVAGYTALQAGLATTPISVTLFLLSPRFGRIASGIGPRLPMTFGPIVAGIGMLMLLRLDASADYVSQVLPGVMVFALGLAATVAPLTATVLDSVEERRVGIASGINNAVSRMAGLLAIAVIGAVVAGRFSTVLDNELGGTHFSPPAQREVNAARAAGLAGTDVPHGVPKLQQQRIEPAVEDASVAGFHLGMGVGGGLMIVGGLISAVGIQDPKRRRKPEPAPRAVQAGECGRAIVSDLGEPVPGELSPVGAGATSGPPDPAL
ncbi:MAG TPA: DHA2 family efflux MFS transporter permease subunit [Solirubrobacterales bacterium]